MCRDVCVHTINAHHQWNLFKQQNITGLGFVCGRGGSNDGSGRVCGTLYLCVCVLRVLLIEPV